VESARRAEDPFASTMRLGIIPTISPYLLPHVVPAVREAYPKLTIRWTEDKTVDLMAGVRSHTLDAAIVALEADLGEVEHAVVSRDAFVLATPIGHDLARRRAMRFSELRDVGVLLLGDGHCLRDQTQVLCANAKARELEFRATSLSTLVQMVASGAGVTLLPSLAVAIEAARARLHIRPLSNPTPHRTIVLAWNRNSVAAAMQRLAATLRRAYPDARRRM
jgi:LysR family hydrogen peroxide-inducible transcriptional activator